MIRTVASLTLLLTFGGISLNSEQIAQTHAPALGQDYEVRDIGALDALVRLGELYDRPMGIVCEDTKIVSRKVTVREIQAPVEQALQALIMQLPGYKWSVDNGVFVIRPAVLPTQTEKMLNIVIPRIFAESIDIDTLSNRLWMEIQIQVDPESQSKGFLLHGHLRNYYELGRIDLTNARIDQVLSEITRRRKSAAWVLLPPPDALKGVSRDRLWGIVTYAKPPQPLVQLCCLRLDYLQ
jgi:hypothetical protein